MANPMTTIRRASVVSAATSEGNQTGGQQARDAAADGIEGRYPILTDVR